MIRKVTYIDNYDRNMLIQQAQARGEYLIEDAILFDEKYLTFDTVPKPEPSPQPPPEPTLEELQEQQLAQAEAIAAIFERLEGGV